MFQVFVRLRIFPPRIKLAASNFARRFVGVRGKQSHILGELCSPRSPKSDESASARVRRPKGSGSERCGGSACVDIGLGQSPLTYLCFFFIQRNVRRPEEGSTTCTWLYVAESFVVVVFTLTIICIYCSDSDGRASEVRLPCK